MKLRVIQFDYLKAKDFEVAPIKKGTVDLAIADPPYNIGKKYDDDETGDKIPASAYEWLLDKAIGSAVEALRPGGVLFWLCPADQMFEIHRRLTSFPELSLLWDTPIVWEESFAQYQKKRMTLDYRVWFPMIKRPEVTTAKDWGRDLLTFNGEDILVESERMRMGDKRAKGSKGKVPGRVWKFRRLQGTSKAWRPWHPCQLPPELLDRIILGFSNKGDTVLDLFAGSGSAGRRALAHDRAFVGVDKSPTYCKLIEEELRAQMEESE